MPRIHGDTEIKEIHLDNPRGTENADAAPVEADERNQQQAKWLPPTALKASRTYLPDSRLFE
jgi:hypothetical protein